MQRLSFDDPINKTLTQQMQRALAQRVKDDINAYCVERFTDEHRTHLGASVIGHACSRNIWYAFRWVRREVFDGRMLRLFNRGNLEEKRWHEWLRGIGFQVWEVDPNTGKQFRIYGAKFHYGGSTDAFGALPYPELIGLNLLLEFKTFNTKQFSLLDKDGLIVARPQHYAQMSSYGRAYGFKYGLYCATNKNDDDIHIECVALDWAQADDLTRKAEDIIFAVNPPPKLSLQPAYYECTYCPFRGPCHHNEPIDKNCRSCRFAYPVDNAEWYCDQYKQIIPKDFIPKGCDRYHAIV